MAKAQIILKKILCGSIRLYQICLSRLLPPACRFYPSCSDYAIEAIQKKGIVLGFYLILKRLFRCHPWCEGGYDPVKPN